MRRSVNAGSISAAAGVRRGRLLRLGAAGSSGFAAGSWAEAETASAEGHDQAESARHGYLPRYGPDGALPPWTFW